MIPVTKPHFPEIECFKAYIDKIYESGILTNNGSLVQLLEERLAKYLGVNNILLVANGTLALQVAYKLLDIKGKVITTPFSFVATTSSLVWDSYQVVFSDIEPDTFNLSASLLEETVDVDTGCIVPVHVFGNPCSLKEIQQISKKSSIPVVYDASHAFDIKYKGQSVLNYGDVSTLSFHATKLFHTIEGGALIINDDSLYEKARKLINFGFQNGEIQQLGINAKMNEIQAAMGLSVLSEIDHVLGAKQRVWEVYHDDLAGIVQLQKRSEFCSNNHQYFPILLEDERQLLTLVSSLAKHDIYPRRYFYPSLDTLPYLDGANCCVARDIAKRILCLPNYGGLSAESQELIISHVKKVV